MYGSQNLMWYQETHVTHLYILDFCVSAGLFFPDKFKTVGDDDEKN